jgi:hypothetical protein
MRLFRRCVWEHCYGPETVHGKGVEHCCGPETVHGKGVEHCYGPETVHGKRYRAV